MFAGGARLPPKAPWTARGFETGALDEEAHVAILFCFLLEKKFFSKLFNFFVILIACSDLSMPIQFLFNFCAARVGYRLNEGLARCDYV
jgi:hypothetical protein